MLEGLKLLITLAGGGLIPLRSPADTCTDKHVYNVLKNNFKNYNEI